MMAIWREGKGCLWGIFLFLRAMPHPMFIITRRSHSEIVDQYKARLADAEARLAEVAHERGVYRGLWLERLGVKFPAMPKPAEVTGITPSQPVKTPNELEERRAFQLDRSEWGVDDHKFFEDYWVRFAPRKGVPVAELDWHYYLQYGSERPFDVGLRGGFPVE